MRILKVREFRGRNIYSHYPVVKVTLDLEEFTDIWTDEIADFRKNLETLIPELKEHHCSRGKEGGFLERVQEGTLLGHVIEHVALEIQQMIGYSVAYGKTLKTQRKGVYDIVVESDVMELGVAAVRAATAVVEQLIKGIVPELAIYIKSLQELKESIEYGPSTKALIRACQERDIPIIPLGSGSLIQLGYGCNQCRIEASITSNTSCISVDIACSKRLTKEILSEQGIPVPQGAIVRNVQEALIAADRIGRPVVIKPEQGNHGQGVFVNLKGDEEIIRAFNQAQSYGKVLLEKHIAGKHYRILVVGEKVAAASEKIAANVVGDGIRTVKELVEEINRDLRRGNGHERSLTKIYLDSASILVLARQKLYPDAVPLKGQLVYLKDVANISTGGTAIDVTDEVHTSIKEIAIRISRTIGLDVAGIDLVTANISSPLNGESAVIEVNAAPGLRMHLFPEVGKGREVGRDIIEHLYPFVKPSRIPLISVTGTNGKTTTTRLISHMMSKWGKYVGMATTGGIYLDGQCIMGGDTTGPKSAEIVLRDPKVEVAVLETARGGILRAGLGYDKASIGVITNICNDHLGLDGIQDMEELARVKALVVEAIEKGGTAVINADDPWSIKIIPRIRENLVLYSLQAENQEVKRHLSTGQKAVFIKNECMVIATGEQYYNLIKVNELPIGIGGLASFNISNALAAVAACLKAGVPVSIIKDGLRTFGAVRTHNPGRCQIYNIKGVRVILDYGHNAAALENIFRLVKKLKHNRLLGVVGIPGDRRNEDILSTAKVAGEYLDYCIVREDEDLRGRRPGEVASLLIEGLEEGGLGRKNREIIPNEIAASLYALSKSIPGDSLVIFYEQLSPLQELLSELEEEAKQRENFDFSLEALENRYYIKN